MAILVEMDIRHQGDMDLLFDLLYCPGRFYSGYRTADDLAACRLQGQDLLYSSFYIFCPGVVIDWIRIGLPPPIFRSPI